MKSTLLFFYQISAYIFNVFTTGVKVNPARREVTIEPGVLLGELDHETQAFGHATPVGVISHTGVYGLVLGGGVGWLCRKFDASVDSIVSADIVCFRFECFAVRRERAKNIILGAC